MEVNLVRILIDGTPVARIDTAGNLTWLDFERFKGFCDRHLSVGILESLRRRDPDHPVVRATAVEWDFRTVGVPGTDSRASIHITVGVEETTRVFKNASA